MLGISIITHKRPNHLYVTLDALFRCNRINECVVSIAINNREPSIFADWQKETIKVCAEFPVRNIIINPDNLLIDHHIKAIDSVFNLGCDYVFSLSDDLMVRSDTLDYLIPALSEKDTLFYGLTAYKYTGEQYISYGSYCGIGWAISHNCFVELKSWVKGRLFQGCYDSWYKQYIGDIHNGNGLMCDDGVISAFANFYKTSNLNPPKPYILHFGICSALADPSVVSNRMFEGERQGWIDNILKLKDELDVDTYRLIPKDFVYE